MSEPNAIEPTAKRAIDEYVAKRIEEAAKAMQAEATKLALNKKQWSDAELVLDQWYKYEQIAMHFNDLLMRFRTQAIAALAAVSAFATAFATAKGELAGVHIKWFFLVIDAVWLGVAILDCSYYSRLLDGAVDQLKIFEATTGNRITFSTGIATKTHRWPTLILAFYGVVLVVLATITLSLFGESATTASAETKIPQRATLQTTDATTDGGLDSDD